LRTADRPDAFYCLSDVLALGVARAAADLGLSVPGDVGLVGVGDTASGRDAPISLTSVRVYPERAGRLMVETLVAAIESDGPMAPPSLLPTEVVARESTARRDALA
jgi:LacI family repressor for deo operon, udp, cdd, tsx, nupC, and nupG